ncbi:stage II sporulation protein E [Thermohalobacter berrensis]|uniref:Stage II sporulation protein E n=1 Tax=Thermohalobacter berrensis TaxID=99594 RepID=A0A419T8Y2_9FIRM|nr:stage II sporulation protein E [Thermohalobacter berrensis]RKD33886.1 stage II sporulation protein E [Thermohalobacter berrensis]
MINKMELIPVRENNKRTKNFIGSKGKKIFSKININYVLINIMSFFITRAVIMDNLTPFGIAFLTAYLIKYGRNIILPTTISLSIITVHGINNYYYLAAIWLIYISYKLLENKVKITTLKFSIVGSIILILTKSISIILGEYFLYDIFMAGFEGIVVFTLSYIFTYSITTIESSKNRLFTNEEIISGAIMLSLFVAGVGELTISNFLIKNIISVFLILLFAYNKGPSTGTAVGVTIGVVSSMSHNNMPFVIAIYGVSGLMSGLFKDLGRIGSAIGFIIGNGIMSFYINGFFESLIQLEETLIGTIIFLIVSRVIKRVDSKIVVGTNQGSVIEDVYSNRIRDITFKRLKEVSSVFEELANTFEKAADREKIMEQKDISKFVDTVADDVCKDCAMYRFCWINEFYNTYHSMFELLNTIELQRDVNEDEMPEHFRKRCIKPELIVKKCSYLFDIYKLNYKWENKILESRQLVSEQLDGVSKIISNLANEIYSDIKFKDDVEKEIFAKLKDNGIDIKEVTVTEFEDDKFEIFLELKACNGTGACTRDVVPIVSDVVGFPLVRDNFTCNIQENNKTCRFKLIRANRYGAVTKVAKLDQSFNYVSGDSYTFGENNNNYYAVLSDGMGVGQKANRESNITISLLEKFLEAGFDKELALKTINSILVLKSNDEMFATVDMSIIDLYRGKAQFIKIGSAPTFIKKKDRVEIVNSSSLPVGILKDVDFQIYEGQLEDGDLIIMMSDGVLDANKDAEDKEKWIADVIEGINSINPQRIADEIIDEAKRVSKNEDMDDMTVLVTKVWKRR